MPTDDANGPTFWRCNLNRTDFSGADMSGASFIENHGEETIFDRTKLHDAEFRSNEFRQLLGKDNDTLGATFTDNDWDEISRWCLGGPYEQ